MHLPEMRESWVEEKYVLLYPREGLGSPQSASQTPQQVSLLTLPPQFKREQGWWWSVSSEKPCFGIKPYEWDPQSGTFREISLVHLKDPTRTARNNRSLQVSLR